MAAILQLRRGTTPSTTIAEPYFNTSLGTLQVGTGGNTITLIKSGSNSGNVSLSGDLSIIGNISGSTLNITGNSKIDGNLQIGGNIILGTGSNDIITVNAPFTGSLIPQEDAQDDLGSSIKRFRELHVVSASIDNVSLPGSGILSSSNENFTTFSQSVDSRLDSVQSFTSSQEILNGFYNSFTQSTDARISQLEADTGSQDSRLDYLELASASHETRLDGIENLTGSFATTGSNIFRGNQEVTGSVFLSGSRFESKLTWPSTGSEYHLFELEPFILNVNSGNRPYGNTALSIEHYETGSQYHNSFTFHFWSSSNYSDSTNFGSEFTVGPLNQFFRIWPSGSNSAIDQNLGNISLFDLQNGKTRANTYANEIHIGAFRGETILIGNTGSAITITGETKHTGSVDVSGSVTADSFELGASLTTNIPALNSTFNSDLSSSESVIINKSLLLGDGKVLVAGRFESIDWHTTNDIARLNSNGTIDTSFTAPIFSATFGGDSSGYINSFVTQSDGKIIVGGNFSQVSGSNRRGLARLDADGTLDTSFAVQSWGSFGEVRDIAIQSDNKIVCVGSFTSGSRRVNSDGTLDTTFDISRGNNQALSFNNGNFYSVAVLDSGSEQAILIGGNFQQWGSYSYPFLVKLNQSGALDFEFAGSNLDIITGNSSDRIQKIKIGDDGYIYIAGRFKDTGIGNYAGFGRVTTIDEGNGIGAFDNGFRTYISGSFVNDFDFYAGDKILLGGSFTLFGNPAYSVQSANRFAIVRQSTGGLVTNWSSDGLASKYNLNTGSVNSVTLLPSDNVLVGGTFTSASFPSTAREGLASLKLSGLGTVTTTKEYIVTADTEKLLVSSSYTYFSGNVNISGSVTASVFSGSFIGTLPSQDSRLNNLELKSASVDISVSQLNSYTSSLKNAISVNGSNLTVIGDLVVQGTTTQIDSTQVNIGENILELNYGGALTKGGIYVKDATGTLTSGSFLWDSTQDRWIAGPSGSESPLLLAGGDGIISSSDQFTSSYDWRYLNTNGDDVVSGSSQINITQTNGYTTFSSSLADRITSLEIDSASQDSRLDALESDSGSQNTRLNQLSSFTASQETLNGFYNSFTASADNRLNNLQSFTSSIDATIKNKLNVEGVVSSSSDSSTIDFTITNGVISGDVIGGVVSGSSQVTQSLDLRYEVSGSVAQLVGVHQISGSLGSAAWYNVSSSIDDGNPAVLGNAGAVKSYIDARVTALGLADIQAVYAGNGLSGGGESGSVTVSLDTSSQHFTNGILTTISSFSSSVDNRLDNLEAFSSSLEAGFVTQQELANATGSLINSIATKLDTGSYLTDSASFDSRIDSLEGDVHENPLTFSDTSTIDFIRTTDTITANVIGGILSSSNENFTNYSQSVDSRLDLLENNSSSLAGVFEQKASGTHTLVSGSSQITYGGITSIPTDIVSASTDSNNIDFTITNGNITANLKGGVISGSSQLTQSLDSIYVTLSGSQTISGTKTFNDIVVNGTGSFAYITSVNGTAKIIGDSFIVVNTDTPTSRYAGLSVYDSGSSLSTASFYFDGQTNDWGYEYSSSAGVDYAVTIFGPEYTTKGSPTYLTTNRIPKAVDNHHLNDSNISDSGTLITLNSNSQVNGNLVVVGNVSANNLVSGSGQITKTLQEVTTAGNTTSTSISITNSTASTSKTTGALVVTGGIGTSGDIFAGGDVVAYASSDRRLKDEITPISNPLEKINQIGGYSFVWNEEKQNIYKGKDYGVIAQEIESILPELVENRDNGYKAVKYDKLVSLLIEGIKDLSKQVEQLKEKINKG